MTAGSFVCSTLRTSRGVRPAPGTRHMPPETRGAGRTIAIGEISLDFHLHRIAQEGKPVCLLMTYEAAEPGDDHGGVLDAVEPVS